MRGAPARIAACALIAAPAAARADVAVRAEVAGEVDSNVNRAEDDAQPERQHGAHVEQTRERVLRRHPQIGLQEQHRYEHDGYEGRVGVAVAARAVERRVKAEVARGVQLGSRVVDEREG